MKKIVLIALMILERKQFKNGEKIVGEVKAKILLQNDGDIFAAKAGYIKKEKIRELNTEGMVDSGAVMLIIL